MSLPDGKTIVQGGVYRCRDGGIVTITGRTEIRDYPWLSDSGRKYCNNGAYLATGDTYSRDLVAVISEPYQDKPDPRRFEIGKRYRHDGGPCPVPGMTVAHVNRLVGHPLWQVIARGVDWSNVSMFEVVSYPPEEKRVGARLYVDGPEYQQRRMFYHDGTAVLRDGKPDWSTFTPEADQ